MSVTAQPGFMIRALSPRLRLTSSFGYPSVSAPPPRPPLGEPADRTSRASAPDISLDHCDVRLFQTCKTYVLDAATSRAGLLIWMS